MNCIKNQNLHNMSIEELLNLAKTVYTQEPFKTNKNHVIECLNRHMHAYSTFLNDETGRNMTKYASLNKICECELFAFILLVESGSWIIQSKEINSFTETIRLCLDSFLDKMPHNQHNILYINDGFQLDNVKVGNIFAYNKYLTTSKDDFNNATNQKFIIKPLPPEATRAREIYHIYNKADEFQVEFKRNTKFKITNYIKGKKTDIIYMEELPSHKNTNINAD